MVDISRIDMLLGRAFQKHFYKINSISFLHVWINIADKAWKKKKEKRLSTLETISFMWSTILGKESSSLKYSLILGKFIEKFNYICLVSRLFKKRKAYTIEFSI